MRYIVEFKYNVYDEDSASSNNETPLIIKWNSF